MIQEKIEMIKALVDDLESVIGDFQQSYELQKLMMRNTECTKPSDAHCIQSYKEVQVLNNVLFDRLNDEVTRFNSIFDKMHQLLIA